MELKTKLGVIKGIERTNHIEYLGVRYAKAGRFEYAKPVEGWEGVYDATSFGDNCPQSRALYPHLEHPSRAFYFNEFRKNIKFTYSEDCLNLNIYAPKHANKCPVILYFYGGGFNSGCSNEGSFDGSAYTKHGVILVTANYRVGILGYLTHEEICKKYGREGNFGLDDQFTAINWVKDYIEDFGGDPENITLMGQSAGAISIQYLCLSEKCRGLYKHAIMLSGAGLFPKPTLPRQHESTREYWVNYMNIAGVKSLDELKALPLEDLFKYIEEIKKVRKDNTYNTMPVVDGYLITAPIDELMKTPLPLDYMIGFTNNDMYAILMSHISKKYARKNNGYIYYFDIDAPGGNKNGAFHSSDLRYVFGSLSKSFRTYGEQDYLASDRMVEYISNFAKTGNPNSAGLPEWTRERGKVLHISPQGVKMGKTNNFKLFWNTITKGDPK